MTNITITTASATMNFEVSEELALQIIGLCFTSQTKQVSEEPKATPKATTKKSSPKKASKTVAEVEADSTKAIKDIVATLPTSFTAKQVEGVYKMWVKDGWNRPANLKAQAISGIEYTIDPTTGGVNWKYAGKSKVVKELVPAAIKAAGFKWDKNKMKWMLTKVEQ